MITQKFKGNSMSTIKIGQAKTFLEAGIQICSQHLVQCFISGWRCIYQNDMNVL